MGRLMNPKRLIAPAGKRYCSLCDSYKSTQAFARSRGGFKGFHWYCKGCVNTKLGGARAALDRRMKYGLKPEEFDCLLESQGKVCAICQQSGERIHRGCKAGLVVDHDHKTGRTRGLLCSNCNHGLGHFRDDPQLLKKAAEYLGFSQVI